MYRFVLIASVFIIGFYNASAQITNLVAAEYFYDLDPGFGNGTSIAITPGQIVTANVNFDLTSLPKGPHKLFVRVKDENGKWNIAFKKDIYKLEDPQPPLPDIIYAEYFFDTDPGFGNGTSIPVIADSIIVENIDVDLTSVSTGPHKLFVRVKDEYGKWNIAYEKEIYKLEEPVPPLPDIVYAEYFFDIDPGFGNGISIPVTTDSIIVQNTNFDMTSIPTGPHKLFVRVKDETGKWNITYKKEIYKLEEPAPPLPDIIYAEYFFDIDPGFGNGITIPVTADSVIIQNADFDLTSLPTGPHKLFVRVKDAYNKWSIVFKKDIYKLEPPLPPLSDIVQAEFYIDSDPGFGNGTQIPLSSDSIVDFNFQANISQYSDSIHYLLVRVKDENNVWSIPYVVPFFWVDLKVFLEGPYNIDHHIMDTSLFYSYSLPLYQPFNSDSTAVWYYEGDETVLSIPNASTVDWVLIQTRYASSPANADSTTIADIRPAFLLKDGRIVGLNGKKLPLLIGSKPGNCYIAIFHRNHLGVLSNYPVPMTGPDAGTYDYTTSADQVFGGSAGHKEITPGIWGMVSGDANGDGRIDTLDIQNSWSPQAGKAGYKPGDFNLNKQVDNEDKNEKWLINEGKESQIPD